MAPDLRHPPAHHRERSSEAGRPSFHAVSVSPYVLVFEHACFHSLFGYIFVYQDVSQYDPEGTKIYVVF